ncbi:bladder cancer associated transcript 1 isoform X1 [Anas platyrhynchos]|uniref:bladder cancer associated transcript 1 isoform X1 n=1 Tax=Anas platyrhynchos TaxID=8839 RepID=UPI003AF299A6
MPWRLHPKARGAGVVPFPWRGCRAAKGSFFYLFKKNRSASLSWAASILRGSFIIVRCLNGRQRVSLKSLAVTSSSKYINSSLLDTGVLPARPPRILVSWGVPTPLLLRGMPQFTFACFCGLHGFCKMKRKKEESSAEQETAV